MLPHPLQFVLLWPYKLQLKLVKEQVDDAGRTAAINADITAFSVNFTLKYSCQLSENIPKIRYNYFISGFILFMLEHYKIVEQQLFEPLHLFWEEFVI